MNESEKEYIQCFITHLEPIGNLLKVCFQRDTDASLLVETHLNDIKEELQYIGCIPKKCDELTAGLICFGKFDDGKYYRIKIIGSTKIGVNVLFIDYGNEATLNISDIRVSNQNSAVRDLLCVTPLATSAFLQGVTLDKPLTDEQLMNFKHNLLYTSKICMLKMYPPSTFLIDISIDKRYLSEILIENGFGKSITDAEIITRIKLIMKPIQQDNQRNSGRSLVSHRLQVRNKTLQSEIPRTNRSHVQFEDRNSSNANTLPLGTTHNAYITHVEDGPFSFLVQLKSHSEEIQPKIDTLCSRSPPRLNTAPLLPGSYILGRSHEDNKFRRAVVMNVKAISCKVYYMDFGTTEELPQNEIYSLPQIIRDLAQPQALSFCLADIRAHSLPESSKDVFAKLVLNKQVLLRVTQHTNSLTQCCEMFLDGKNVKDLLINLVSPLEYTNQFPPRGREILVNVSFVDCPTQFFVQYQSEIHILGMIQDSLSKFCPHQDRLQNMSQVTIGSPIGSLYSTDNSWYRAMVIGIESPDTVNVMYVDYGNRDNVRINQLCNLNRELVTKWRSQAVECCLIGFENATPDALLAEEMENKVLGGQFTLKLQYLLGGNRFVVDLIDENGGSIVKMMNDLVKAASTPPADHHPSHSSYLSNQSHGKYMPNSPESSLKNKFETENRSETGGGDSGGGGGSGRFSSTSSNRSRNNTESKQQQYQQRQYNKHSEHDDRLVEDYEDLSGSRGGGGDRYKKKWEDRNGAGSKWREEERGPRFGGADSWEDQKSKDRSERSTRSGGDRNSRFGGERGGRFSESKRHGANNDDDKYSDRSDKYKGGGGGDRFNRYGVRGSSRGDDDEEKSEHSSTGGDRGSERSIGGGRHGSDRVNRGGGDRSSRRSSGDYDSKHDRERKFGDRGGDKGSGRFGSGGGGGGGDRFRGSGGGRWNDKRPIRDKKEEVSTSGITNSCITETTDDWDEDKPSSPAKQITYRVTEYQKMDITNGETYSVYFCVMGAEPNEVYVQMAGSDTILEELREQIDLEDVEMSKTTSSSVPKEMLTPGLPVLARFADDQLLYRAIVRSTIIDLVTVLFIDYGNFAQVPVKDLYTITPAIAEKPAQALRVLLSDLKPAAEKWQTDLSIYEPCYGNDELILKVNILKCIDGEIVSIGSLTRKDGKTVSQKLIEEGLALSAIAGEVPAQSNEVPTAATTALPNIPDQWKGNLDLLVGQTFYSTFLNVVNKNTFLANIIEAKLTIECTMEEEGEVPDITADTKIILCINGLEEYRLLVFIYDSNGKHLGELDRESISPICPMPVVKTNYLIYICHFDGDRIFIQNSASSNELSVLLDRLFERYDSSNEEDTVEWKIGMICCVISEDGNWYRAKIISTADDKYLVMYIDYGNTETVGREQLRQLDSEFFTAELCLGVQLPVEWIVSDPPLMKYVENEEFNCTIGRNDVGYWVVDLRFVTTDENLTKKLVDESLAKEIAGRDNTKSLAKEVSLAFQLTVGSSLPVVVSHVDTPTMFWVQLCTHLNIVEDVQQKLQECIEKMPSPIGTDKVFAAKYSEDNMWYRAIATGEGDQVRFIDYGNTDPAPIRKQLPADLLNPQKGYAIPMYLCVQPSSDNWSNKAIKLFETFIEQQITAEIKSVGEKIIVDLKSNEQCLSKLLVEGNHAKYMKEIIPEEPENDSVKACIVDFVDVNNFYVQFENQSDKLTEITQTLLEAENFDKVDNSKILKGNLLAAKYSVDEQWYRVKISSVNPLQGFFIDYGNISDINECRRLPDRLKMILPLALHCSMGIENVEGLTDKFASMAMNVTMFNLRIKTEGDINIVELFNENGELVNDILSRKQEQPAVKEQQQEKVPEKIEPGTILKNCVVCHANGPYDFYIQTPVSQGLAEDLTEKLGEAASFPNVDKPEKGEIVAVLYPEDNYWYRCKISDTDPEISGVFIDYGNGTVVSECRSLPEEMKSIPNLALKCSLQLPEGVGGGWSAEAVVTFTEQVNDSVQSFDVEVIAEGEPMVVELIVDDESRSKVTEELLKLCPAATPVTSKPATRAASPFTTDNSIDTINNIPSTSPASPSESTTPSFDGNNTSEIPSEDAILNKFSGRCFITHVNSPVDFFARDSSTSAQLEKITLALSELEDNFKQELPYSVGDLVIAQVEGEFFRAKILEIEPLKVYLIDIGNTSESSNLLQVPESIKNIPPTAVNYALNLPKDHILLTKAGEEEFVFLTTAGNTEFDYKILSKEEPITKIELFLDDENIIELIMKNISRKKNVIKNTSEEGRLTVTIPYVKSLDHFYIQEVTADTEILFNCLLNANLFKPLEVEVLNVGEVVAALSKEDSVWYRAKIINLNPLEVFFVDYGNTSIVDEVRQLPDEISKIPFLSKLAKLEKPENISEWSQKQEEEFITICDPILEFSCTKITKGSSEPIVVKLFSTELDDISTILGSKCEHIENKLDTEETVFEERKPESEPVTEAEKTTFESSAEEKSCEVFTEETETGQLNCSQICEDKKPEIKKDDDAIAIMNNFVEKNPTEKNEPSEKTNIIFEEQDEVMVEPSVSKETLQNTRSVTEQQEAEHKQLISSVSQESLDSNTQSSKESLTKIDSGKSSPNLTQKIKTRVKTVAEIKANAKPRIVTRPTSAPSRSNKSSTSSPTMTNKLKNVESKKTSQSDTQIKRSTSFEDKIIPGCVAGHVEQ